MPGPEQSSRHSQSYALKHNGHGCRSEQRHARRTRSAFSAAEGMILICGWISRIVTNAVGNPV